MSTLCLFCANDSGSREHLWPAWIHARKDFGPLRIQRGNSAEVIVPNPHQKVKTVCGGCNNGWMSDLEAENIPLIGSMFQDLSIPLGASQQHCVAAWAVKTSMIFDSAKGQNANNVLYTKDECMKLHTDRTIPPRTRIGIGRLSEQHLATSGTDFTMLLSDGTRIGRGLVATTVAGHFVVQVVTTHLQPEYLGIVASDAKPKAGEWDRVLIQIWPMEREVVMWPPKASFTNGGPLGIGHLMDRWRIGDKVVKVTRDGVAS